MEAAMRVKAKLRGMEYSSLFHSGRSVRLFLSILQNTQILTFILS